MAAKKATVKRSHERMAWVVVVIILLLLLLGFMLAYFKVWPFSPVTTTPTTSGTESSAGTGTASGSSGSGGGSSTSSGSSGSTGATGATGSTGAAGSNGSTVGSLLFNLYGQIASGQTKQQVEALAGSLKPSCTAVTVAQAQVCTYTQGDQVVTVTYQNERVVAVAKSGF